MVFIYLIILHVVFLTDDDTLTKESKKRELDNLIPIVQYCGNTKVCRRTQLLSYFSEVKTEANLCKENAEAICDNCESANVSKPLYFNLT